MGYDCTSMTIYYLLKPQSYYFLLKIKILLVDPVFQSYQ